MTTDPGAHHQRRIRSLPAALLLAGTLAIGLAACSGGGGSSGASSSANGGGAADGGSAAGGASDSMVAAAGPARGRAAPAAQTGTGSTTPAGVTARALIRTGSVELSSTDVEATREQVVKIADRYAGEVDDERGSADERGELSYARLVLRIPSADYDRALSAVKGAAHLDHATSHTEDVTTELIDTSTRLRAQRRSIARIEVLYDRADSIRTVIAIERELAVRQAALESLERRVAYLHGQTAMSTLTVTIDRATRAAITQEDHDGFLAGLAAGWHALTRSATAAATALGALLPWTVAVAVLAVPGVPLVRWVRRRLSAGRSGRTPSAA